VTLPSIPLSVGRTPPTRTWPDSQGQSITPTDRATLEHRRRHTERPPPLMVRGRANVRRPLRSAAADCSYSLASMSGMHFERMALEYVSSRPPYPPALYEVLKAEGVIGPGTRVLEIGAGSGLATRELVRSGSEVVAIEPGRELASLLKRDVPGAPALIGHLEDAELPDSSFDSAVAATSMHWVDLSVGLPRLYAALRPRGWLAVWRHRFGDDSVDTEFRRRVEHIVAERVRRESGERRADDGPTMHELTAGTWFEPVRTEHWRWSIDLDTDQLRRLFRTFSDWNDTEVEAVARAADELGGVVTEHYQSILHLLKRAPARRA
jgi:SAM-dependent methyltransferase